MSRPEDRYRYGSTSEFDENDPQYRLDGDGGGEDEKRPFLRGAIRGNHINDAAYQKAGKGFSDPSNRGGLASGGVADGAPDVHYDHIDFPWNHYEYAPAIKNQPAKYSNPSARADKSSDTRATASRARASCSDECLTNDDGD